MALSQISIPADAVRDQKAAELAKTAHVWPVVTLRKPWGSFNVGDQFRVTPNGYRVNAVVCECEDYQRFHNICKHIRAIVLLEQRPTPTRIRVYHQKYSALFPECAVDGCDLDPEPHEKYCHKHVLVDAY